LRRAFAALLALAALPARADNPAEVVEQGRVDVVASSPLPGLGVPLVAVHVWRDVLVDATMAPLLDWDVIDSDEREVLAERLAGWSEKYPDVPVRRLVARDRPARALVEESGRAQLVVVGTGDPGLEEAFRNAAQTHVAGFFAKTIAAATRFGIAHELLDAAQIRARWPQFDVAADEVGYFEPTAGFVRM